MMMQLVRLPPGVPLPIEAPDQEHLRLVEAGTLEATPVAGNQLS